MSPFAPLLRGPRAPFHAGSLLRLAGRALLCRGCLAPMEKGGLAGLCRACWSGLVPLPEARCSRCALIHSEEDCPDPTAWTFGDALWDYRGGRPPFGALILPGIKAGEQGWRRALLARVAAAPLPSFTAGVDLVTSAPTVFHRRWLRGFDLAEEVARLVACRGALPFARTLCKGWSTQRQAALPESARRGLPRKAVHLHRSARIQERVVLLVDDVWTTGTTLLRCAQALRAGGAAEVRVLTLFRAT